MKKKLLIALLCTMMTLVLGACTNKSAKITEPEIIAEPQTTTEPQGIAEPQAIAEPQMTAQTELTKEAEDMMQLFNAMNSFFFEIKTIPNWSDISSIEYDPEDNMQYWSCLARVASLCGAFYGDELVTLEDDYYKISANVMREFAYACFAGRNQLDTVPIPDSVDATVYYDYDWDAYFVKAGDTGAVKTIITSFTDNKDGTYVAEVDYVDPSENDMVMQHSTYELVDNEIADMSMFPYAVKNIIID